MKNIPYILSIGTGVPSESFSQECFAEKATHFLKLSPTQQQLLKRITSRSRIEKRHAVLENFKEKGFRGIFPSNGLPTTGDRNKIYQKLAPQLAENVCRRALENWGEDVDKITHIISISCTGLMAPGLEFLLVERLNLQKDVERLGINFMGCFGAFKGLAIAKSLAQESAHHRILVVCTELCSLHFQEELNTETFIANSLFADGAAAIVVGADPQTNESPLFKISHQKSRAIPHTLNQMTWEIGDHGNIMHLDAKVPKSIKEHIRTFTENLIGKEQTFDDYVWGIHPGGKAIVKAIEEACQLKKEQVEASWEVLRDYGNMSSPTFLFVLDAIHKRPPSREWVIGLGFGPGLSVEGVVLKHVAK